MILKNSRVISPADNLDDIMDIKIENGIIVEISKNIEGDGVDYSGKIIAPGFVEMHCHLREPGFEYKETIQTGIESAINGGYTAICPMANTNPVVDNIDTLKFTIDKAKQSGLNTEFCPVAAITKGLMGQELTDFESLKNAGAIAFSDDGRPLEDMDLFKKALLSGELIMSHAEEEITAVARELEALREVGGKLHFAHISRKGAVDLIRNAKKEGLNVTCETAPHYFSFIKEDETENGRFKMNPPLCEKEDLDAIIEGLIDGTIDCIATDHAPHSLDEKLKPFSDAPFGIVGFETAFGATMTNLVKKGHLTINQAIEKLSVNPAKILGLKNQGQIKLGQKANLTVINPNLVYTVNAKDFKSKCKISPFEWLEFTGKVIEVIN